MTWNPKNLPPAPDTLEAILSEIKAERQRQDEKWGKQNHPVLPLDELGMDWRKDPEVQGAALTDYFEIPSELAAKNRCDLRHKQGRGTYMDIILEELCEAVAAGEDVAALRAELIQTAACCVAAVESLDRNGR